MNWDLLRDEEWERIKSEGKPFADSVGEGLLHRGKKHYTHIVVASKYQPTIPPWPAGKLPWEA